jgi:hypothetical protein
MGINQSEEAKRRGRQCYGISDTSKKDISRKL